MTALVRAPPPSRYDVGLTGELVALSHPRLAGWRERDGDLDALLAAPHSHRDPIAKLARVEDVDERRHVLDRLPVDHLDDIAEPDAAGPRLLRCAQTRAFCRRARRDAKQNHTFFAAEKLAAHVVSGFDGERRPNVLAVSDDPRHDAIDRVHGDGEPDAGVRARRAVDHGVDTDEATRTVDQRAARVAGIDRGIGLDDVLDDTARLVLDFAIQCRDDASRQRVVEAERIADREHGLADAQLRAAPDRNRRR